jgi:hypothetical protein
MGHTIENKQSAAVETFLSTSEKCFVIGGVESPVLSVALDSEAKTVVYFEIED